LFKDKAHSPVFNKRENVRHDQRYQQLKSEGGVQQKFERENGHVPLNLSKWSLRKADRDTIPRIVKILLRSAVVLCWADPVSQEFSAVNGSISLVAKDPWAIQSWRGKWC
jgi:hypothetical protein